MSEAYSELEQTIRKEFSRVKQLEGVFQVPLQKWLPMNYVANKLGFDNYRVPTTTGLKLLAKSIEMYGLIERPILVIDKESDEFKFVDGRRRMSACYINNYQEVPFDVYRLSKEQAHELELSLNALKTSIPIYDRVEYASGLREEFLLFEEVTPQSVAKEIASVMNLTTNTVKGYFQFLDAHSYLQEFAKEHKGLQLYSQVKQIARKIPNKNQQIQFFKWYKENHLEKEKRLHAKEFTQVVNRQAEIFEQANQKQVSSSEIILFQPKTNKIKSERVQKQAQKSKEFIDFLKVYTQVIALDESFQKAIIASKYNNLPFQKFLSNQLEIYQQQLQQVPKKLSRKVQNILVENVDVTFAQMQLQKLKQLQREEQLFRPEVVANKAIFVPTKDITRDPNNLRSEYDLERIEKLSLDIKINGQIKAGIITPSNKVPTPYMSVVGNSRHYAVELAKIPFYKAFILEHADSAMIKILQAVEDLYEADTYFERAQKLYNNYVITKESMELQGKEYSAQNFIEEKQHLATKKTLEDAMYVMSLSPIAKHLIREQLTSVDVAKSIDMLDEGKKVSSIINILSQKMNKQKSLDYIASLNQPSLFSSQEVHSYQGVINNFYQQVDHASKRIELFTKLSQEREEIASQSERVFLLFAKAYKELENLYSGLGNV